MKLIKKENLGWHTITTVLSLKFKTRIKPKKVDTLNLIFEEIQGIGNRIFGLMNSLNYFSPNKVNLYWLNEGWVSAKFSELFIFKDDNIIFTENSKKIKFEEVENIKNSFSLYIPPCNLKTKNNVNLGLQFDKIQEIDKAEYRILFSKLKPSEEVQKRINETKIPEKYISLQIRNAPDWEDFGRNEQIEHFITKMKEYPVGTKFYISSMSKEITNIIRKNSGFEIFELNNKNYKSMIDAVADVYLLANGEELICSYGSTFAELAWWLGGAKQTATVIGDESKWNNKHINMKFK